MRTIFLALLFGGALIAQNTPASPLKAVTVAPSGACPSNLAQLVGPGGTIYTCQNGTWGQVSGGGGGISGLTTTKIPKATSSTTIGDSALNDNGTTVTSAEPIAAPSASLGASPPAASVCTTTGSFLCVGEGAAPTGTLTGVDVLYPDATAHRWKMVNNNGSPVQVVASGADINASDQVQGILGVPFCSGYTPTNGQAVQYTTGGSPNPCYTAATASGGGSGGGTSGWSGITLSLLATATQFTAPVGGALTSATETVVSLKASASAAISGLTVTLSASLGTGTTLAVTLEDGTATPTALTCTTASAGTSCSDTTHSVNVTKGDLLSFKIVASGTVTAATPQLEISYAIGTSGVGISSISTTAAGSPASLTVSAIPAGNLLTVTFNGRSNTATNTDFITCFFNGDNTAGNYSGNTTTWTGTTAGGTAANASFVAVITAASSTSGFPSQFNFVIPEFAGTTLGKSWGGMGGGRSGASAMTVSFGGTWSGTAAITSIACTLVSGSTFLNGSVLRASVQ